MCGQYNFSIDEAELREICKEIDKKYEHPNYETGEIYPTNTMPVLIGDNNKITPVLKSWGYTWVDKNKKKVLTINAKIETVQNRKMFAKSFEVKRCVIPTSGFYEWSQDSKSKKYLFNETNSNILFLAGLYRESFENNQYIILTTNANSSVKDIHNRMPVVLQKEELQQWLFDSVFAHLVKDRVPIALKRQEM